MRNKTWHKITSIVLTCSMLAANPGNYIAESEIGIIPDDGLGSMELSSASEDVGGQDIVVAPSSDVALPEDTGGGELQPMAEDIFVEPTAETPPPETAAPETAAPETAAPETAAPETAAPETAAPETAAPETTASAITESETTVTEAAAGAATPETTASETAGSSAVASSDTASADHTDLSLMEDDASIVHDMTEAIPDEEIAGGRTLEVQMMPQKLYLQHNVPSEELDTVNRLWETMFARDPEPGFIKAVP